MIYKAMGKNMRWRFRRASWLGGRRSKSRVRDGRVRRPDSARFAAHARHGRGDEGFSGRCGTELAELIVDKIQSAVDKISSASRSNLFTAAFDSGDPSFLRYEKDDLTVGSAREGVQRSDSKGIEFDRRALVTPGPTSPRFSQARGPVFRRHSRSEGDLGQPGQKFNLGHGGGGALLGPDRSRASGRRRGAKVPKRLTKTRLWSNPVKPIPATLGRKRVSGARWGRSSTGPRPCKLVTGPRQPERGGADPQPGWGKIVAGIAP